MPNLVKIGPVVLEKKMLTDDGRQPIAIGHLSDSGDLKMWKVDDNINNGQQTNFDQKSIFEPSAQVR